MEFFVQILHQSIYMPVQSFVPVAILQFLRQQFASKADENLDRNVSKLESPCNSTGLYLVNIGFQWQEQWLNYALSLWLLVAFMSWSGYVFTEITAEISVKIGQPDP